MTATDPPGEFSRRLVELDEAWAAQGANRTYLRAGLAPAEIEASLAETGLPVTADVVTWFGWHDGARNPALSQELQHLFAPDDANRFIGDWYLVTLTQALAERHDALEAEVGIPLETPLYRQGWLPLLMMHTSAAACVDLGGEAGVVGAVYLYDPHGMLPQSPPEPWFGSMGDLVTAAAESVRSRAVGPDLQISDPASLPESGRRFMY